MISSSVLFDYFNIKSIAEIYGIYTMFGSLVRSISNSGGELKLKNGRIRCRFAV